MKGEGEEGCRKAMRLVKNLIPTNMDGFLGRGTYGAVTCRSGCAIKKFHKLAHLTQEYCAMRYLEDCEYVVHCAGIDFSSMELAMDKYDLSLRQWLNGFYESRKPINTNDVMTMIRCILCGLIELHDRGMAHGDLKPNNILVKLDPFHCVLGDLGFVSVGCYSKCDRTAPVYRDIKVNPGPWHDMYSLGVIMLEMVAKIKLSRQPNSYSELSSLIKKEVKNKKFCSLILSLVSPDHKSRPTARVVMDHLFGETPPLRGNSLANRSSTNTRASGRLHSTDVTKGSKTTSCKLSSRWNNMITQWMKKASSVYKLHRAKKGYGAVVLCITRHSISRKERQLCCCAMLMVLSSLFGPSGFSEDHVLHACEGKFNKEDLCRMLELICSDQVVLSSLFN